MRCVREHLELHLGRQPIALQGLVSWAGKPMPTEPPIAQGRSVTRAVAMELKDKPHSTAWKIMKVYESNVSFIYIYIIY